MKLFLSILTLLGIALAPAPADAGNPKPIFDAITLPMGTITGAVQPGTVASLSGFLTQATGNTALTDLQTNAPPNASASRGDGTLIQFCSVGGCLPGPHMLAQTLFQATTRLDGTAQEQGLAVNFSNVSGYAPNWTPAPTSTAWSQSTGYANGAYVTNGGQVYQQSSGASCNSASTGTGPASWLQPVTGGAPNPTASNIVDGTCKWDWRAAAAYRAGLPSTPSHPSEVQANGNVYVNTVDNCTPASSGSGPSGTGTGIADGTCRWNYQSNGLNTGKSGLSLATTVSPGGGPAWGFVSDFSLNAGVGSVTSYGHEDDCNNSAMDSYAGSPVFMLCHFTGGGSNTTFPMFADYYIGSGAVNSGNVSPYGYHYAFYVSGQPGDTGSVAKDGDFASADNASTVLQALAGRNHALAFLDDESNSTTVLRATGTHNVGIDLSFAQLNSGVFMTVPDSTFMNFSGGGNTMGHNGALGALTYGSTNSGTGYRFASFDNGNFAVAGGLSVGGSILTSNVSANGLNVAGTAVSTSPTTGAATIAGGIGVVGSANVGGSVSVGGRFNAPLHTPTSSSEACVVGDHFDDANYHYVCVATNTLKRVALSGF